MPDTQINNEITNAIGDLMLTSMAVATAPVNTDNCQNNAESASECTSNSALGLFNFNRTQSGRDSGCEMTDSLHTRKMHNR